MVIEIIDGWIKTQWLRLATYVFSLSVNLYFFLSWMFLSSNFDTHTERVNAYQQQFLFGMNARSASLALLVFTVAIWVLILFEKNDLLRKIFIIPQSLFLFLCVWGLL